MKRGEKVGPEIEAKVCELARDYPAWSQMRIAGEVFQKYHLAIHRSTVGSILQRKGVRRTVPRRVATDQGRNDQDPLAPLLVQTPSFAWGRGSAASSFAAYSHYWLVKVKLEITSDRIISVGDFALELSRGDVVHELRHLGNDVYGSSGSVPMPKTP